MKKQKLLIVGITMNAAGSEKSFLSFANCLDFERFEVTLLLAKAEGAFLSLVPAQIQIVEMGEYAAMFTMDGQNAVHTILNCFVKKNPFILFEILPYFLKSKLCPRTAHDTATRLWCRLMQHMPAFHGTYDAALAYWGDKTMFYMCDKVHAKRKIAWLHFDYAHPQRDDKTYLHYFNACDTLVTVSAPIQTALCDRFPALRGKCVMMENIIDASSILRMAEQGEGYPDTDFCGQRILTIGRIAEQKGYDLAVEALSLLLREGRQVRWYILGGTGTQEAKVQLLKQIDRLHLQDAVVFLPCTQNPYRYLKECDIYVQPSRHEGKPIAVEEAKILEKPILVTNYLSANDQLRGGALGKICDISVQGIYQGIKLLLDHPEQRAAYCAALHKEPKGNADEMNVFYRMLQTTPQPGIEESAG